MVLRLHEKGLLFSDEVVVPPPGEKDSFATFKDG